MRFEKFLFSCLMVLFLTFFQGCGIYVPLTPLPGPDFSAPSSLTELYDVLPDLSHCYEGILKEVEKQKALEELNFIRNLHSLNPVIYDYQNDAFSAKAALIIVASKQMSHFPDSSLPCWTQEGYFGSSKSNLYSWEWYDTIPRTEDFIKGWIIDDEVESLGHRRWLLNPFLKQVSFGRVDIPNFTGAAMRVIYDSAVFSNFDFVAYPCGEYPRNLFVTDWYLSFSAVPDKRNLWNNRYVGFSQTSIEVFDEAGNFLQIYSVKYDNEGYGVPNNLQWKYEGLKLGVSYTVRIRNVRIQGVARDYEYWFKVV